MLFVDIDDTLLDHTGAERTAAILFGQSFGESIPDYQASTFPNYWHELAETHFAAFLGGETDFQGQRRRRIRELFREPSLPESEADRLFAIYLKCYDESLKPFPDVLPFLEKHAGEREGIGVISNGGQAQQAEKLYRHGLNPYLRPLVTAESTGYTKPDPRIFFAACKQAKAEPKDSIYIGDSLEKDVIGAQSAGLRGIWLNRNGESTPCGVESIGSLEEF